MIARPEETGPAGGNGGRDPVRVACDHCGLPVPKGLVDRDADRQFCCGGCRAVWESLHACGLGAYYELRRREHGAGNVPAAPRSLAHLDGSEFLARHARTEGPDLMSIEMRLDGVRCGACVWLLEALPRLESGLRSLRVNLGRSTARIEWSPSRTSLSTIAERLAALGYEVAPLGDPAQRDRERRADRRWVARIGIAGAVAGNAMAIAFALYGGMFTGMDAALERFLHWTSVGLAAIAVLGPGRLFLRNAAIAIRTRTPHVDLPIAAALLAGLFGGVAATVLDEGGIYAESVCMLVFLLLVGRFVQHRQQRRARHEVELLCSLVPSTALRIDEHGATEAVAAEALRVGDLVEVPAGEALPADGDLVAGDRSAWFDLAILTGESRPVAVADGDAVFAGSRPTDRPVRIRVTARGGDTRAAGIARLVEEATSRRAPVVAFANRIGAWFLMAVLILAAATTALWWHAGPAIALERAVALLVVTCPCALGLATPLAMTASIAKAARRGLLLRGGDVLERLARPGTIVLDKTGTLTLGRTEVVRVEGDAEAVALAAALERGSVHPVARALVAHAGEAGEAGAIANVRERIGMGVVGTVGDRRVAVGRRSLLLEEGLDVGAVRAWDLHASSLERRGTSPVWIAIDGEVRAIAGIGDPLRPEAAALVGRLREEGWRVRLLSGDVEAIATPVGGAAGIDHDACRGGATPESKADEVADPSLARPVVMVGDGVNDLAAMAAADVGIAVRNGTASALATADVCLPRGGLEPLLGLLAGARRTLRTIHVNFAISLAYNLAGGTLAVLGLVDPLVAAVIMPLSGLTVTAVALRMPRFRVADGSGLASSRRTVPVRDARDRSAPDRTVEGRIAAWS